MINLRFLLGIPIVADVPKLQSSAPAPRWKLCLGYFLIAIAGTRAIIAVAIVASNQGAFEAGEAIGREAAAWIIALPIAWVLTRKVRERGTWPRPLVYGASLWLVAFMGRLGETALPS